ncbi:MAG: Fe-S protein assembly co-chaperone HscB [Gammaproteobacteria bacterium]|nr:Fe-S protein assembly co-chaperone HscB [Gammaproteobacteria bacterium]MBU1969701.1 Fe-S protein assembly co-chaperone HscB [Gammaproteobacteria bacterium]
MPANFQQDFFSLFNLPRRFQIDGIALEQAYRDLQAQVHPDKFAHLPEADRRLSMQWTTRVNEAFQTLRSPLNRARYLLTLHGVDTQEESNTSMPVEFLMQQMEWREALEEALQAKDMGALETLEQRMQHETRNLQQQLAADLDDTLDFAAASGIVRKLKFLEKLAEEIHAAYDEIDN